MADSKIVYGNVSAVRTSILERMKDFIDNVYDPGSFVPTDISEMMKEVTDGQLWGRTRTKGAYENL